MPVTPRNQSRTLCRPKPFEKRTFVHQSFSLAPSDDENGDATPTQTVDTADKPGFPTYVQYKGIETAYLESLSPRKRDKALVSQSTFDKIWDVLNQPRAPLYTSQFRFWVRKMFTLSRIDTKDYVSEAPVVILHDNRPVAVQEQLYQLFCYCHEESDHGGRDRTFAVIRQHYSWVPKELTAQFVKACPTCTQRRGNPDFKLPKKKTILHNLKDKQVEESESSLSRRGSLEESSRFTEGPHGQSTMSPDRTVDVDSSRDNTTDSPSTCLPYFSLRAASPELLLHPLPSSLNFPSQDLNDIHSRQMLADFSCKTGLLPLALDTASLCSCSTRSDVKLPSLSDLYWDNTDDDQYKLNDLCPENISDSLPPELQRFQLTSPVRTQQVRHDHIHPAMLMLGETSNEREGYVSEGSPLSPYSPPGSGVSPYSSMLPYSSASPYSRLSPSIGFSPPIPDFHRGMRPLSLAARLGLLPSQSRYGSTLTYLTPVLTRATSNGSMPPHVLPFSFSPPSLSPPISPFTSTPTTPTFDEDEDDDDDDDDDELLGTI